MIPGFRMRHAIFAIVPLILLVILTTTNNHIDVKTNVLRSQPFFLMFVAKVCMVIVLLAQHPWPDSEHGTWKFWRWVDPVTVVLLFMFIGSGMYYFLLWSGQSGRWVISGDVYHAARLILWVDGYASSVVAMEMIARAIEARREQRKRNQEYYDITQGG